MPRHRPFMPIVISFALGIWIAHWLRLDFLDAPSMLWMLTGVIIVGLVGWFLAHKLSWPSLMVTVLLLAVVLSLGLTRYTQQRLPINIYHQKANFSDEIQGVIVNYPKQSTTRTRFVMQADHDYGRIQVFYDHASHAPLNLNYGDRIVVRTRIQAPTWIDDFNYPEYLAAQGIWAIARPNSLRHIELIETNQGQPWMHWGQQQRDFLFEQIDTYLTSPADGMFKALLFGERALLDDDLEGNFRNAGVAHVLAVSGLHLGILMTLFWGLLRWMGLSRTWTYVLVASLVLIYLILVGFKVSLVRAALLFGFMAIGHVFKERGWILSAHMDSLQGWALAALVILWIDPQALFSISFQLSFAATAAILLSIPLLEFFQLKYQLQSQSRWSWQKRAFTFFKRNLVSLLWVGMVAQLGVMPFVASSFHKLYLGSLLSNLFVVPLVTLILWSGVLLLLSFALPFASLSQFLGMLTSNLLDGLNASVTWLSQLPAMVFDVDSPPGWLIVLYVLVLIAVALWLQGRWHQSSLARASVNASERS